MRATRRSQPYRRGSTRRHGKAFMAMMAGRDAYGRNPADAKRAFKRGARRRSVRRRT